MHIPLHFDRRSIAAVSLWVEYYWYSPSSYLNQERSFPGSERRGTLTMGGSRVLCPHGRGPTAGTTLVVVVHQPPERAPNQARRSAMHLEQGDGVARLCRPSRNW